MTHEIDNLVSSPSQRQIEDDALQANGMIRCTYNPLMWTDYHRYLGDGIIALDVRAAAADHLKRKSDEGKLLRNVERIENAD